MERIVQSTTAFGDQIECTKLALSEPAQHGGKFAATPTTTRGTDEIKFPR
ncbi:hypothetical protein [Streptomyces sp. CA-106110]